MLICTLVAFGVASVSASVSASAWHGPSADMSSGAQKHALEDTTSWELHLGRRLSAAGTHQADTDADADRRLLQADVGGDGDGDGDSGDLLELPFTVKHKKQKKHIPFAGGDTTHGIMIDAGSQGTRLHIYEWKKKILLDEDDLLEQSEGKKLSYPTSVSRWTDKYTPGLDVFANFVDNPERLEETLGNYLGPLLDFAQNVLRDKNDEWHTYPIYLKATGGLRTLPQPQRIKLLECVRKLFHNETFNPFQFEDERARVISGEEEAIYGWVGVNFAKGVLIDNSKGSGVGKDHKLTYGMIEMGGASTQIANFQNDEDVMANLFKLQLGGTRHWNVYVHSYLYFGINGAWSRFNGRLHSEGKNTNPCLPLGSTIQFNSWMHMNEDFQFYPRSHPKSTPYSVTMDGNNTVFDYQDCSKHANDLLRKSTNQEWCDFQMDGNCGFAGIYQPPTPKVKTQENKFIATSNFADVYKFLRLQEKSFVSEIGTAAEYVCNLSWKELKLYNSQNTKPIGTEGALAQMCFRSTFVYQLLRNGWGFGDDFKLTAVDVIGGQKMGWALGCMLYEINTLPWTFHPELLYHGPSRLFVALYIVLGILSGLSVGFMIAMRCNKSFNKTVVQSVWMKTHPEVIRNPFLRKSLSLPGFNFEDLDDINEAYNENEGPSERTKLVDK